MGDTGKVLDKATSALSGGLRDIVFEGADFKDATQEAQLTQSSLGLYDEDSEFWQDGDSWTTMAAYHLIGGTNPMTGLADPSTMLAATSKVGDLAQEEGPAPTQAAPVSTPELDNLVRTIMAKQLGDEDEGKLKKKKKQTGKAKFKIDLNKPRDIIKALADKANNADSGIKL